MPAKSLLSPLLALFAGALLTLSFAPFNAWPLSLACPAVLAWLIQRRAHSGFTLALLFGLGLFGSGSSWVYVSIHDFGYTAAPLALLLTGIFVSALALVFALPFYALSRFFHSAKQRLLAFPLIWVLGEWSRSWFLTGFPWLFVGYAHTDTTLAGWAPVWGVYGLSLATVYAGIALLVLLRALYARELRRAAAMATAIGGLFLSGMLLQQYEWTQPQGKTIDIALVQPNIPLAKKWSPSHIDEIYEQLGQLHDASAEADLVVWPEAALPELFNEATVFIDQMDELSTRRQQALITGILYDDLEQYKFYNAIMGLGLAQGLYFKQRLVPFGEYVPLEHWLRGIIAFFDLPNSVIHKGPKGQAPLHATLNGSTFSLSSSICYEVVYPDLVAANLADAELMITISNDAWFGRSIGPLQHFQMARMRAMENGRPMLRATNTGLSGIISHTGDIVEQGEPFLATVVKGEIAVRSGNTPFAIWQSYPVVLACLFFLTLLYYRSRNECAEDERQNEQ